MPQDEDCDNTLVESEQGVQVIFDTIPHRDFTWGTVLHALEMFFVDRGHENYTRFEDELKGVAVGRGVTRLAPQVVASLSLSPASPPWGGGEAAS